MRRIRACVSTSSRRFTNHTKSVSSTVGTCSASAAARPVRVASGIFSDGGGRYPRRARQPMRIEPRRAAHRMRGRAELHARISRKRVAAHLGRRRFRWRMVSCAQCRKLSPQMQYMKVVNAIAAAQQSAAGGIPVAYLAYHDTIEPDRKLRPLPNVWFEWAPRERCYIHAIDDPACNINPRYHESLKRYIDIFEGRGHVFEYYADAILFGGSASRPPPSSARSARVPCARHRQHFEPYFRRLQRARVSSEPRGVRAGHAARQNSASPACSTIARRTAIRKTRKRLARPTAVSRAPRRWSSTMPR